MTGFLRFIGLLNAAVWLGAAISFTFALGPALFSPEMKAHFPPQHLGFIAQIVIQKYFLFSYWCGAIAVIHLVFEKLYLGKKAERLAIIALSVAIALSLLGGIFFQPKLRALHLRHYDARSSQTQRSAAGRSFGMWHGVSQAMNLLVIGGLLIYFSRLSASSQSTRFSSAQKFRS